MGVLLEGNFFVIRIVYDHTNACYGPLNGMANSDSSHPVIMYIKCSISNGSLFLSKIGMVIVYIYLMLPSCLIDISSEALKSLRSYSYVPFVSVANLKRVSSRLMKKL